MNYKPSIYWSIKRQRGIFKVLRDAGNTIRVAMNLAQIHKEYGTHVRKKQIVNNIKNNMKWITNIKRP